MKNKIILGSANFNQIYGVKRNFIRKNEIRKLADKIGFDVSISLEKRNAFLTGKKGKILRLNQKFKLNLLIVYPNVICSTKRIYEKNKKISLSTSQSFF